ncbi:MAG: sugar transferase [Paracoccaceae bacterium]|jgi:exopolysaccharide production protein ExoY|nr:sugar transferase [Paracoccaceae bacterium]MDH5531115.1 sugar transferase [Paracoccaceae bacterium]
MTAIQAKSSTGDVSFTVAQKEFENPPAGGSAKRVFDILFSLVAILSVLPFFLILPAVIYIVSPGPVFFSHKRIGFRGKSFPCLKFRTMVMDADRILEEHFANNPDAREEFERHRKLKNDPRIIPVIGSFLRKSSLDELPQFINVFRGEMSVVGPRPLTLDELRGYGEAASRYKSARPGITGLWQVSGRSDLTFCKRVELDSSYVSNCTLLTDVWLIAKTIGVLLSGRGAY